MDQRPPAQSILLISPPITKPGEPSAGICKLGGVLRRHGIDCRLYDAGIDCLLALLDGQPSANDTWTRRALAHRQENVEALRTLGLFRNRDRYRRAVMDLNRVVQMAGRPQQATISLTNYTSHTLSPVRSRDLVQAAEQCETNPFYAIFSARLKSLFTSSQPDIVGLSINFMSQALCAFAMIGHIRSRYPETAIVIGGGLVTSWMRIPGVTNPFAGLVDEMIGGPGENRLLELCTGRTAAGHGPRGYDFSGCEWGAYLSPLRVLPYDSSRGCYWKKCAFCPETAEDALYRAAGTAIITEDLRRLANQTDAGLVHFLDNALSPRLLEHLISHPPGIPWYGFARITRHLSDTGFVRGLKASGCIMLKLGVESGDQAVLDALNKGIAIDTASRALATLHRAGIATYVYLLFGTPSEDEAGARRTLAFTTEHAEFIDFLNLSIFNLPAHGPEADHLDTMDFYAGDLSLYREFKHPAGWNRHRVRSFLSKVFKKQAAIRTIVNHDPPFFTSNHAPFFHLQ